MKRYNLNIEYIIYFLLVIIGCIYVLNTWSPSSYGFFLESIGEKYTGIVWGHPRAIRSDEWAVVTPLTQALVHNDFQQFNSTSLYNENFRINYGLPIYDWGLIFKPTMWGYLFLSPAYAYSLHWFLVFSLFIIGYLKLLKKVGLDAKIALMITFILYFSGYSQFWWNEKGPIFALFPWVFLILITNNHWHILIRLLLFYWLASSWFITNLYPPVILSLIFIGALYFLCYGQYWFNWKKIVTLAITSILSVVTAFIYLSDYLIETAKTVYPGSRSFSGGSVPIREIIAQFQPFSMYDKGFNPIDQNISEIGVVSLPFILMILCHLNWKKIVLPENRKVFYIFSIGLGLMLSWMIFPIPAIVGKVFLWNYIQPERMEFAEGILLAIVFCLAASKLEYTINIKRLFIYSFIIFSLWYLLTKPFFGYKLSGILDLWLILAVIIAYGMIRYLRIEEFTAFVFVSMITLGVINGRFNPIQSADAIFNNQFTVKKTLDKFINKDGVLAYPGFNGATLNGLGYKSVTHVTAIPKLDFWRKQYPNLPDGEFNRIFNRYSHIILNSNISEPNTMAPDQVHIPLKSYYHIINIGNETDNVEITELRNDRKLQGEISVPNGNIQLISILIGNYNNTSNGILDIKVCSNNICTNGQSNLIDSKDNDYYAIKLDTPLEISNESFNYEIRLSNSTNQVAIYSNIHQNTINPKIILYYQ